MPQVFGYDLISREVLGSLGVAIYAAYRFGGPALLTRVKSLFGKGQSAAQALLNPTTDIGDVMEYLKALDAYSDAHKLGWGDALKKMLNEAGAVEFDKEAENEAG